MKDVEIPIRLMIDVVVLPKCVARVEAKSLSISKINLNAVNVAMVNQHFEGLMHLGVGPATAGTKATDAL